MISVLGTLGEQADFEGDALPAAPAVWVNWAAAAVLVLLAVAVPPLQALGALLVRSRRSAAAGTVNEGRRPQSRSGTGVSGRTPPATPPKTPTSPANAGTAHPWRRAVAAEAAAAAPGSGSRGRDAFQTAAAATTRHFFGLGIDEVESSDEDSGDELTQRELRRLQETAAFHGWCQSRSYTRQDLEESASRLRLYRRLRALHPSSFWQLCRPDTRTGLETVDPGTAVLLAEYLASLTASLAALAALLYCWLCRPAPATAAVLLTAGWWVAPAQWLQGRPAAGPCFAAWHAELERGHKGHAVRAVLAGLLEAAYCVGTLGIGAAVSAVLRCRSGQSVGERLAGVRMVQEVEVRLDRQEQPE